MIDDLRMDLYRHLVEIANLWNEAMGIDIRYPEKHSAFIDRCYRPGQTKPTPLLLSYGINDYNCLHRDFYGEHVFPLQAVFMLPKPEENFAGDELILTEQRPRMQSRVEVAPLEQGRRHYSGPPASGTRHPWQLISRDPATRREPDTLRQPPDTGSHIPRRGVSGHPGRIRAQLPLGHHRNVDLRYRSPTGSGTGLRAGATPQPRHRPPRAGEHRSGDGRRRLDRPG